MSAKSAANQSWEFSDRSDSQRLSDFITSAGNVIQILLEEGISGKKFKSGNGGLSDEWTSFHLGE